MNDTIETILLIIFALGMLILVLAGCLMLYEYFIDVVRRSQTYRENSLYELKQEYNRGVSMAYQKVIVVLNHYNIRDDLYKALMTEIEKLKEQV